MKRILTGAVVLYAIVLAALVSCNDNKTGGETKAVSDAEGQMIMARTVTGGTKFIIYNKRGDSGLVTYTPSAYVPAQYTPSTFDTIWYGSGGPVVTPPPDPIPGDGTPAGYTLIYQNGFDKSTDLDPDNHGQIGAGSLSTTVYKTGPGAFKSVPSSVSSGYRSEVQLDGSRTPAEGRTEVDVYFENYTQTGWGGSCIQWHPNNNNSGNVFMYSTEGKFTLTRNLGGSNMFQGGSTKGGNVTITSKRWYRLAIDIKWSTGNDGYVRTYIDGNLDYTYTGRTQDANGIPYLKVGQNNWEGSKGTVIYYDNLKVYKKL